MPWIRTISWDDAEGPLKAAYDWQAASLGEPAEFTMLGSLYPAIVDQRLRLYKAVEGCPSGLDEVERQLPCYVTSLLNHTAHCASGLRLKLASLGVDEALLDRLARLDALCRHASKLTTAPGSVNEDDIDELRRLGLDDLDIVDLNNRVAYYNYINRVANGLGLRTTMSTVHEATRALPA
jgi:uncharacterized peroxidase-related enzyme